MPVHDTICDDVSAPSFATTLTTSQDKPVNVADNTPTMISAVFATPEAPIPAVLAVLEVNELLEAILLGLDMKTLLLAHRVSRNWRANIGESKPLQKKLFFLPAREGDSCSSHNRDRCSRYLWDVPI